jgi:hypothetical protein
MVVVNDAEVDSVSDGLARTTTSLNAARPMEAYTIREIRVVIFVFCVPFHQFKTTK